MRDWLKYAPLTAFAMPGSQADSSAGGGSKQEVEGGNKDVKDQNNIQDNDDNFANLWQDPQDDEKQKQTQDVPSKKDDVDDAKFFDDYLKSINFSEGVDLEQVAEDLTSGKTDSLATAVSTAAQNAYKRAMVDTDKLMRQRIDKAVETAVSKSRAAGEGDVAVRLMQSKLSFTKDPAYAPIAKAVLSRNMQAGKNVDEAIELTGKFFSRLGKKYARDLQLETPPRGGPRGGFNPPSGDDEDDDSYWMELLSVDN